MGVNRSPLPRFRVACERGSLLQAEAAARELGRLGLDDALRLVLLYLREGDRRFEPAAVRFIGRVLVECPGLSFENVDALLDGLSELDGIAPQVARSRAALALTAAGLPHAAKYIASAADLGT
jgi:hypothetical protein